MLSYLEGLLGSLDADEVGGIGTGVTSVVVESIWGRNALNGKGCELSCRGE